LTSRADARSRTLTPMVDLATHLAIREGGDDGSETQWGELVAGAEHQGGA